MVVPAIGFVENREPHAMVVYAIYDDVAIALGDRRTFGGEIDYVERWITN
jgi:hypothetical protein